MSRRGDASYRPTGTACRLPARSTQTTATTVRQGSGHRLRSKAELPEQIAFNFETTASLASNTEHLAVDDAPDLGTTLTERANPELLSQFKPQLADRLLRGPFLLNTDLKAGKSRVWKTIRETDHPCAIGQFA